MSQSQSTTKLSIKQLQAVFGISHMTAYQWRKGTKSVTPLPQATPTKEEAKLARPPVLFNVAQVKAWAKKNKIEFAQDPDKVLAGSVTVGKSGPKTKAASKPAKAVVSKAKEAVKKIKQTAKVIPIRSVTVKKAKAVKPTEVALAAAQ